MRIVLRSRPRSEQISSSTSFWWSRFLVMRLADLR